MQTSETGSDTGSTVTLQTSVASQAAVPTQVVQQVPVQQQVSSCCSQRRCCALHCADTAVFSDDLDYASGTVGAKIGLVHLRG